MLGKTDIAIRSSNNTSWLNAAGLVFEWIGYPRWGMWEGEEIGGTGDVILVDRTEAKNVRRLRPDQPALLEVTTEQPIALPCRIACEPRLHERLRQLSGLYTHLENYNGMRGLKEPFSITVPSRHRRATPRRRVAEAPVDALPGDPICFSLSDISDVLVRSDDGMALVAHQDQRVFFGLPIISMLGRHLTAPAMDGDAYLFSEPVHHLIAILDYCIELIAPAGICRVAPWPRDTRGVFALRHDLDRSTDLGRVVQREARLGVPPTVHVLADQLPQENEVDAIQQVGGEIALHGRWLDQIGEERKRVAEIAGTHVLGHSVHGGREADGWRGLRNLLAAHEEKVEYTELLSEMHLWPHRIPDLGAGHGASLYPIAMPHHLSFDVDMRTNDSDRLSREIGRVFAHRGLFTLMNHPDIHFDALERFLEDYLPPDVPRMTLLDVTRWWKATHTQDCLQIRTTVSGCRGVVCIEGKAMSGQVGLVVEVKLPRGWSAQKLSHSGVDQVSVQCGQSPFVRFMFSEGSTSGFWVECREQKPAWQVERKPGSLPCQ